MVLGFLLQLRFFVLDLVLCVMLVHLVRRRFGVVPLVHDLALGVVPASVRGRQREW